jgi:hypothetical protein
MGTRPVSSHLMAALLTAEEREDAATDHEDDCMAVCATQTQCEALWRLFSGVHRRGGGPAEGGVWVRQIWIEGGGCTRDLRLKAAIFV